MRVAELAKSLAADDANSLHDEALPRIHKCPECDFLGPAEAVDRHKRRTGHEAPADGEVGYALTKAMGEKRFTFGPLYMPNTFDAHAEWATPDDLQEAAWDYFRNGDRKLRKQHGREVIGEIVEMVSWPYDHDAEFTRADGTLRKQRLPAGTVYCGVRWSPSAWQDVKAGRITGLSMGGSCVRVKGVPPA